MGTRPIVVHLGLALAMSGAIACVSGTDAENANDAENVGSVDQALVLNLNPNADTWVQRTSSGFVDYGKSCELRVNDIHTSSIPALALLKFPVPLSTVCSTLSSATLRLLADQGFGMPVSTHWVSGPWVPGGSGYSPNACSTCNVASTNAVPFAMPGFGPIVSTAVVDHGCAWYKWDVTAIAKRWCTSGANNGILLTGERNVEIASFHSMEAPAGTRPILEINY
ncbi:DNRLRE domain-containing protein [Pendulispora brunnea]|uniref:DNRLRE domain-containing protein n=1 Tax=Pendulispora brunnea TaxID=2905690 RepID=A0ABZ2JUZ8_9BACT